MLEQTSQCARADHPVVSREEWLAHTFLDLMPKGGNETAIMDWVKRHDAYEADAASPDCCGT